MDFTGRRIKSITSFIKSAEHDDAAGLSRSHGKKHSSKCLDLEREVDYSSGTRCRDWEEAGREEQGFVGEGGVTDDPDDIESCCSKDSSQFSSCEVQLPFRLCSKRLLAKDDLAGIEGFESSDENEEERATKLAFSNSKRRKSVHKPSTEFHVPCNYGDKSSDISNSSSPVASSYDEAVECSRLKTSEWVHQLVLQDCIDSTKTAVGDDSFILDPSDSSKRRSTVQFINGGLADRTFKLVQKELSEVLLWQKKVEQDQEAEFVGDGGTVTVLVLSVCSWCGVIMTTSRVLCVAFPTTAGDWNQKGGDVYSRPGQTLTVVFPQLTAAFLNLRVGHRVKIHQPWSSVKISCGEVLMCAHFSQCVGESLLLNIADSSLEHQAQSSAVSWQPSHGRVLSRSPAKSLQPTCLFPKLQDQQLKENGKLVSVMGGVYPSIVPEGSLSAAISHNNNGHHHLGDICARLIHVYRQKERCDLRCQVNYMTPPHPWRWTLLVKDECGHFAEIRMPFIKNSSPSWNVLLRGAEDRHVLFSGLRLRHSHVRSQRN